MLFGTHWIVNLPVEHRPHNTQKYPTASTTIQTMEDASGISAQASLSAKSSLKRTRILYATNPQTAFLPTTDPVILQRSIDRRKRKVIRNEIDHKQSANKGTLALITTNDKESSLRMDPVPAKSSTTLAIHGEPTKKKVGTNDNPGGGILVVSCSLCIYFQKKRLFLSVKAHSTYLFYTIFSQKSSQSSSNRLKIPTPTWHAPWKLSTVLSSHLVRFQTRVVAYKFCFQSPLICVVSLHSPFSLRRDGLGASLLIQRTICLQVVLLIVPSSSGIWQKRR